MSKRPTYSEVAYAELNKQEKETISKMNESDFTEGWIYSSRDTLKSLSLGFFCEMIASSIFGFAILGSISGLYQDIPVPLEGIIPWYGNLVVGLSSGFGLTAALTVFKETDAGFLNPAVLAAAWAINSISMVRFFTYFLAEFIGWILAASYVYSVIPVSIVNAGNVPWANLMAITNINADISIGKAIWIEALLTFIFTITILSSYIKPISMKYYDCLYENHNRFKGIAAITCGFTFAFLTIIGYPLTGASMNPFRSLCAGIIAGQFGPIGVYFAGPFAGAGIAAVVWWLCCLAKEIQLINRFRAVAVAKKIFIVD
jgi:glycerol uptake facilitator-like aquaporin